MSGPVVMQRHDVPPLGTMPVHELVKSDALLTMAAKLFGFSATLFARRHALRLREVPTVVLAGEADKTAAPEQHAAWIAGPVLSATLVTLRRVGRILEHARPKLAMPAIDEVAQQSGKAVGAFV